ncbi:universal stress protein [Halorhodospira halophila]|uniref:UspA domain protein n=1 Tax=Halorhodospira halophila (strain DSM 244 / SL1) TaxID=349124 RepID=A1WY64_HALHL|nr:universal stress protein [Halorhodospira halophila]ABM62626.1 UspA domain protein [Halorhodospira halophila SL1]MBK1728306.1 universal stress protein [Halorhodospira halophila]
MSLRQILFASDLSPQAALAGERAAQLAGETGAGLGAVYVIDSDIPAESADGQPRAAVRQTAEAELQNTTPGQSASLQVRFGNVLGELAQAIEEEQAELLVVGAHGQHYAADWLLGTSAEQFVRHLPVPTLVVRNPAEHPYRRILVATDFSACARAALQRVATWFPEAELEVVHVLDTQALEQMRAAGVGERWVEQRYERQRAAAESRLREELTACGLGPGRVTETLLAGYPAEALLGRVRTGQPPDLVVLGNHGRGRWGDLLLGSVASRVLHQTSRDLMLVRSGETSGAPTVG